MSEQDDRAHSPRGPSTAHRFTRCLGAPNAEAGLPDKPTFFAAEGTVFHEIAANCLEFGMEPEDFLGQEFEEDGFRITVDAEMCGHMHAGLTFIRDHVDDGMLFVEKRVDISPWVGEGEFGTTDAGIINVRERLIIGFDWKYGAGVPVSPEENEQQYLYLLGLWNDYGRDLLGDVDPEEIEVWLVIEQPRSAGGGGIWKTTLAHVFERGEWIKERALLTYDPDAPRTPGEKQCQFCKAAKQPKGCYARNQMVIEAMSLEMDDIDDGAENDFPPPLDHPDDMTPERRSYIVLHSGLITGWLKQVKKIVLQDAMTGRPTPGVKAVAGRQPPRKYKEGTEEEVEEILVEELADDAFKKELISPTQAEKKLSPKGYTRLSKYVDRGQAKIDLVPDTSEKPALPTVDEHFTDDDVAGDEDYG